jgi:adenylate kinase
MARGDLVPDDVVVAIVADRISEPDAQNGFILDGFPRTVPQAEALDRMLEQKGLALDAVIELKVDENALLGRIKSRVAHMIAQGEPLRPDDNPDSLRKRLDAYRVQTAPLTGYYAGKGVLKTVDGMASIDDVTAAIAEILSGTAGSTAADRRRPSGPRSAAARKASILRRSARLPLSRAGAAVKPKAAVKSGAPKASEPKVSASKASAPARKGTPKPAVKAGAGSTSKAASRLTVKSAARRAASPRGTKSSSAKLSPAKPAVKAAAGGNKRNVKAGLKAAVKRGALRGPRPTAGGKTRPRAKKPGPGG